MWTDRQIKGAKPKDTRYRLTKPLGTRIPGSLVLEIQTDGAKVFYFQYHGDYINKKGKLAHGRILLKIGTYKKTPSSAGWTLEGASDRAREYADLIRQGTDPKDYVKEQELIGQGKIRQHEAEKRQGTLGQLLESYLTAMKDNGKRSHESVRRSLRIYVLEPFPDLISRKANTIEADDIRMVLARMIANGVTTHSNRVRSYLSAAFSYGLQSDNNPRRFTDEGTKFNLKYNPVLFVPKQSDYERVGEHVVKETDIKKIWKEIGKESLLVGCLVKQQFATGQRAGELARLKWGNLDIDDQLLTIPGTVTKNKRDHVLPLGDISMSVYRELHRVTGKYEYMFPARHKGKFLNDKHISDSYVARVIREYCSKSKVEKFICKDIRRTWKTLAGRAGIDKGIRDRCQNHALQDVSSKHYDRYDYLAEKRAGMKVWNDYLELIINPDKKVTHLKRA